MIRSIIKFFLISIDFTILRLKTIKTFIVQDPISFLETTSSNSSTSLTNMEVSLAKIITKLKIKAEKNIAPPSLTGAPYTEIKEFYFIIPIHKPNSEKQENFIYMLQTKQRKINFQFSQKEFFYLNEKSAMKSVCNSSKPLLVSKPTSCFLRTKSIEVKFEKNELETYSNKFEQKNGPEPYNFKIKGKKVKITNIKNLESSSFPVSMSHYILTSKGSLIIVQRKEKVENKKQSFPSIYKMLSMSLKNRSFIRSMQISYKNEIKSEVAKSYIDNIDGFIENSPDRYLTFFFYSPSTTYRSGDCSENLFSTFYLNMLQRTKAISGLAHKNKNVEKALEAFFKTIELSRLFERPAFIQLSFFFPGSFPFSLRRILVLEGMVLLCLVLWISCLIFYSEKRFKHRLGGLKEIIERPTRKV